MPTNRFPRRSSVHIIGNAELDLGTGSGNVRAVSPKLNGPEKANILK